MVLKILLCLCKEVENPKNELIDNKGEPGMGLLGRNLIAQ